MINKKEVVPPKHKPPTDGPENKNRLKRKLQTVEAELASKDAGELLFNLLSSRNEVGSIIITSNLSIDKWDEVFKDKILTGAIVDRLTNKAHLIDMSGESYRIRQTRMWMEENNGKE